MICIECSHPAESLLTVYSHKHIQLTDCCHCQKAVDRYIEFDNVLLFIDLLLLKPEAYRHLVYNSLDHNLSLYIKSPTPRPGPLLGLREWFHGIKNWLIKFDKLNRVWLLLIAFEIYLTWAIEERKFTADLQANGENGILGINPMIVNVFSWDPLNQYFYFTFYCLFDIWVFHNLTRFLIINWYRWGKEVRNAGDIVSYAILLSYGAKIFPILMLIWPYDTVFSMNIIKLVANLYVIESLRIVTNLPYGSVLLVSFVVSILRWIIVKFVMVLLFEGTDLQFLKESFKNSEIIYPILTLRK